MKREYRLKNRNLQKQMLSDILEISTLVPCNIILSMKLKKARNEFSLLKV